MLFLTHKIFGQTWSTAKVVFPPYFDHSFSHRAPSVFSSYFSFIYLYPRVLEYDVQRSLIFMIDCGVNISYKYECSGRAISYVEWLVKRIYLTNILGMHWTCFRLWGYRGKHIERMRFCVFHSVAVGGWEHAEEIWKWKDRDGNCLVLR